MKLTAQIKLLPTDDQAELLKATLERCNAACKAIGDYAWDNKVFNAYALHKALYETIRQDFDLGAQPVIRCLGKVADAYKQDKNSKREFSVHGAIAYDERILSYRTDRNTVSILT